MSQQTILIVKTRRKRGLQTGT